MTATTSVLRVAARDGGWVLSGADSDDVRLVNGYLGYLATGIMRRARAGPTRSTCWRSAVG